MMSITDWRRVAHAGAHGPRLRSRRVVALVATAALLACLLAGGRVAPPRRSDTPSWLGSGSGTSIAGADGPMVVLLHSNTGTSETWKPQIGPLSAAGYRVIAFDRRGWGKSLANPATGPQPGTIAEDLHMLVECLHIPRFHLVGIAGGTFAALDYVAAHPERVVSLVASASTASMQDPAEVAYRARITPPGFSSSSFALP